MEKVHFTNLAERHSISLEVAMTEIRYSVGVDIASSTFTAAVGEMPWKLFLKPQTFENTEDGYQTLIEWFRQHHLSAAGILLVRQRLSCSGAIAVGSQTHFQALWSEE